MTRSARRAFTLLGAATCPVASSISATGLFSPLAAWGLSRGLSSLLELGRGFGCAPLFPIFAATSPVPRRKATAASTGGAAGAVYARPAFQGVAE